MFIANYSKNDAKWFIELNVHSLFCWISLSTAKLASGQQKHLLFEVEPGSDATALWKVAVRVLCTKVRPKLLFVHASHANKTFVFL